MRTEGLRTARYAVQSCIISLAGGQTALKARNWHRVLRLHLSDAGSYSSFAGVSARRGVGIGAMLATLQGFELQFRGYFGSLQV